VGIREQAMAAAAPWAEDWVPGDMTVKNEEDVNSWGCHQDGGWDEESDSDAGGCEGRFGRGAKALETPYMAAS